MFIVIVDMLDIDMNKKFVYSTTKMRSKTVQRILDNMGKDPWWVKLKRWFVVELHTVKCLGIVKYIKHKI